MRNLTITKKIKCEFTPNQWELLTNKFDDSELRHVVNDLNEGLEVLFNSGESKAFTLGVMMGELKKFKQYGAYDSEPMYFLERVVNEIYGE
jgi:hypothetical protein